MNGGLMGYKGKGIIIVPIFVITMFLCLLVGKTCGEIFCYKDANNVFHVTNIVVDSKRKGVKVIKTPTHSLKVKTGIPNDYINIVKEIAKKESVDPNLIFAIIKVESNFRADAISPKGAVGLMQLMPSTASQMEVRNPFDPKENIWGGTRYLKTLLGYFGGDLKLALAAYNCGINKIKKYNGIPSFPETKSFVEKVVSYYRTYTEGNMCFGYYRDVPKEKNNPIYTYRDSDGVLHISNAPCSLSHTW